MRCHVCGSRMKSVVTDLPFKVHESTIVILKGLPVFQCEACTEYLLDDSVMQRVDEILYWFSGKRTLRGLVIVHKGQSQPALNG
jgi:YgiT-type zinc finger domain-containing protein